MQVRWRCRRLSQVLFRRLSYPALFISDCFRSAVRISPFTVYHRSWPWSSTPVLLTFYSTLVLVAVPLIVESRSLFISPSCPVSSQYGRSFDSTRDFHFSRSSRGAVGGTLLSLLIVRALNARGFRQLQAVSSHPATCHVSSIPQTVFAIASRRCPDKRAGNRTRTVRGAAEGLA